MVKVIPNPSPEEEKDLIWNSMEFNSSIIDMERKSGPKFGILVE